MATSLIPLAAISLILLVPLQVDALNIKNNVDIDLNTGGNQTNDQSGSNIRSGDTSLRLDIDNNGNSSQQTDSRSNNSARIRLESDGQGENSINIRQNDSSLEVEQQNGQTQVRTTNPDGQSEVKTLDNTESIEITGENGNYQIHTNNQTYFLSQTKYQAFSKFPLSVNSQNNQLTVSTPSGTKAVTTLPDQTVQILLDRNFLDDISSNATPATDSANLQDNIIPKQSFSLTLTPQGEVVYVIEGTKRRRFFGLVPITVHKTITVSADNGDLMAETYPNIYYRLLDTLSI